MLEDESGRIALGGAKLLAQVGQLITGVVVAVKGTVGDDGVMDVSFFLKFNALMRKNEVDIISI